jgi:hypothetical protein
MQWRLVAVGVVISAVCGTGVAWQRGDHAQAAAVQQQTQASGQQQFERAQLLPRSPLLVLLAVMRSVAELTPERGCPTFSSTAAARFAAAAGTTSCEAAIVALHAQVTDPTSYRAGDVPDDAYGWGPITTVTGCTVSWSAPFSAATTPSPGPRIGTMRVEQQYREGYLITDYQPCVG